MKLLAQNFSAIESGAGVSSPSNLAEVISNILPYVYGAAGIVLLLNIVSSGLKMMTSASDPKGMQAAQAKLTTSVIGVLILAASVVIVQLLLDFLGVNVKIFK